MRPTHTDFLSKNPCVSVASVLSVFLFFTANAQDFVWSAGQQRAFAELQTLKLQAGRQLLNREPANGVRVFLDDYADMLQLATSDDEQTFATWRDREDQRLGALKRMDDGSPWQRVMQAEVRLHWAFVKLKFGNELSASWDVIRAYKLLADNQKRFPDFLPTYKSLGTLHVLLGSVPDSYAWVTRLLGLRGNIRQGQTELLRAQADATFGLEARLIDLLVRAYVLHWTDADAQTLRRLVADHHDNLLLAFFGATIAHKAGQGEQALTYLANRPVGSAYQSLPIIENVLGDLYLQKGQYTVAIRHYGQFLAQYRGQNFLKDTYYKLFLCHWLAGEPVAQTQPYLTDVLRVGRTTVESDKAAQTFAQAYRKRGTLPGQQVLMRARLASDGGFTDSALAYLRPYAEARFADLAGRAEYNYRMGRIYQRRNDPDAALPYLTRALSLCDTDDGRRAELSFGASAALQLGYIYGQKNDRVRARSFFEKALSFKHHAYKNSVDNKARAGLSQLY